jgi:5'(3')-deoxyribonucleotidase
MRLLEFTNKPTLYLDMDGVLADFFGAWAPDLGGTSWEDIKHRSDADKAASIRRLSQDARIVRDFFQNLKILPGGVQLLAWLSQNKAPFTILSSPLQGRNADASIEGKRLWLADQGLSRVPAIFSREKYRYATQPDGTANILIDDYGKNITAWTEAGGQAIKHDDATVQHTLTQLQQLLSQYKY